MTRDEAIENVRHLLGPLGAHVNNCHYDFTDDTIVVGDESVNHCSGCVWVFGLDKTEWVFKQTIVSPLMDDSGEQFGEELLLSPDGMQLTVWSWDDEFHYDRDASGQFVRLNY